MKHQASQINLNDAISQNSPKKVHPEFSFNPIAQLELKVDQNNKDDIKELNELIAILDYPSDELAQFHSEAMRLGNYDIQAKETNQKAKQQTASKMSEEVKVCVCCGFKRHTSTIPVCTPFENVGNVGTSTYLFFATFKNLSILLIIMTLVYSVYSLVTNVISAKNNAKGEDYTIDYLTISLASKQSNDTIQNRRFYFIQAWIGLALVIVWIFVFFYNRYREIKEAQEYDDSSKSASDYSIAMEGMPLDITEKELQASFDEYFERINRSAELPKSQMKQLKIKKLNIGKPFFMTEDQLKDKDLEEILKEIEELKDTFRKWIKERQDHPNFVQVSSKQQRQKIKKQYLQLLKKKAQKIQQQAKKISQKLKEEQSDELTTIFVSFQTNIARNLMLKLNDLPFLGKIKAICKSQTKYWLSRKDNKFYTPYITKAPEPEDIVWTNIGRSDCNIRLRKLLIYTITLALLGVGFIIVYQLSLSQQNNGNNRTISIAISVVISIVNFALGFVIKYLTVFEKDYTTTYRQSSLAVKSIIAQMMNSILTPVITAYYIKTNAGVYKVGGLVDNIFMMAFTNSFIPPLITLIDPYNIFVSMTRCLKSSKSSKLTRTQKEHNLLYEGIQFEIGSEYIYVVNLFMFTCFFVSLQPIVSVIALIGYAFMYWVEKYCLFNRYRRPVPGTDFLNKAVYQIVFLGPPMYCLGSLTWSNFDPSGIPREALVPNLIALLFSALLYLIPMSTIIEGCGKGKEVEVKQTKYDDERIFFSSEYDRANPSTSPEGIADFEKFRANKLEQIKKLPKEQQQKYEQQMRIQAQRAALSQPRPSAFGQTYYSPYQQYQYQQPAYMPYMMPYGAPLQYQNPYAPMMPQPYVQQPFAPQIMGPPMMAQPMMAQPMMPMMGGYNPNPFNYQPPSYSPYGGGYNPYQSYGGYRY